MIKINGNPIELASTIPVRAGEEVTVDLASGGHWYGHGFNHDQPYPLEQGAVDNPYFAVNNIQCPIWMCSKGHVFLADTREKLSVSLNKNGDGKLRISSESDFELRSFSGETLVEAWKKLACFLNWKRPNPPVEVLGDCWFCTWTQYPRAITQERIVEMGKEIRRRDFPCSTLVIDDRWESCFGELEFGSDFPDPKTMIEELHKMDFKVVLWVTPFVNDDSAVFAQLAENGALVQNKHKDGAALFKWWGGTAGLVDLTAEEGRAWYRGRLKYLKNDVGVDGFKIDGGDAKYMPSAETCEWNEFPGASGYSDILLKTFEEIAPGMCETRTAWLSQSRDIIWRLGGKDSHWGMDNGLKALVNLSLHLSLMGYDLLIPDMIPGRVQTMDSSMALPTDELMVRWTEVSCLMPLAQFSYFPWNYAEATLNAVHGFAKLHKALQHYIVESVRDDSAPLIRPMWFADPENHELYEIGDQFLLGQDLLVCPVLDEETVERSVVIPKGEWLCAWTGERYLPGTHERVSAPCPGIPLFVRATNNDLFDSIKSALESVERGTIKPKTITATHQCGLDRDLSVTG